MHSASEKDFQFGVAVGPMPGGTRLFVGNLPPDVTDDQLQYVLPLAVGPHHPDMCRKCPEKEELEICTSWNEM